MTADTKPAGRSLAARAIVVALLAVVSLGLAPSPAAAETTIEVTTPADGRYQPGVATPLLVTIAADRAISGTLSATFDGFRGGSLPVEVPGGSAKEVVFIVTVPPWSGSGSITFDGDDPEDDRTSRINLIPAGGDELVAVLPELAARDLPATAGVATEIGVARLIPFDVDLLDSGSEVLSPFTQMIATGADLQALDGERLDAIEAWVGGSGGVLVIDEQRGAPLPIDVGPAESALGGDTSSFGLGLVRFTDGRAAAGAYDGLVEVTPSRSFDEFPWGGGFGGGFPTTNILAADAGVRVPAIGSLVLMLIAYALVAGPVLWFLLRRTRREPLLWLALPAVAIVTTGGVYLIGQALRDESSTAHATLYADLPTQRLVSSQVLVTSPNGGSAGVRLDGDWRPARIFSEEAFFDGPFGPGGAVASSDPVLVGDQLAIDLPPGGVGVIGAETTQDPVAPSWSYDLEAEGDNLIGTVTNLTPHELQEVFVTSGQGFARIQSIAAGETADVTLRNVSQPPINGDPMMERLWRFNEFPGNDDGPSNPGVLVDWLSGRPELRSPGFIVIVGWTRDEAGPLPTSRGAVVDSGRTAFLTADRLAAEVISPEQGRLEFLRGWSSTRVSDQVANDCTDFPATVRLTPAPGVADAGAALAVSRRAVAALDVWDGDAWVPAGMAQAPPGDLLIGLPTNSLDDGALYVRVQMSCEFWGMQNPFPSVRATVAGDEVLTIGALGEGDS